MESVKQMLADIFSIMPQVIDFYKNDDKYKILLEILNKKDYWNSDIPYPTLKELEIKTGMSTYKLRREIKEIYEGLFHYETGCIFDFPNTEILFYVEFLKKSTHFRCNNLTYLPRVGENISLYFLRAKLELSHFYVNDVEHSFKNNKHTIDIWLIGGTSNSC
ncbi:hypothetical protein [Aquimarina sp. 2304DJ70-9]|uniref:hypothetical protein n=1 Tax=Aquimarina penaris TaxID=3231044 RepID=UPI0034628935